MEDELAAAKKIALNARVSKGRVIAINFTPWVS